MPRESTTTSASPHVDQAPVVPATGRFLFVGRHWDPDPDGGCDFVLAVDIREARAIAATILDDCGCDDFTDLRVTLLRCPDGTPAAVEAEASGPVPWGVEEGPGATRALRALGFRELGGKRCDTCGLWELDDLPEGKVLDFDGVDECVGCRKVHGRLPEGVDHAA